ncbi:MAG: hypothetical protein ABI844_17400 [Saprospiraceae bacterium]
MAKTKYDFIRELLEDRKINQNQRERILELASREISLEGTLEERIQKIEDIVFKNNLESNIEITETLPIEQKSSHLPKYFDPYYLYKFLFEYNQNVVLRSTCHDTDSGEIEKIVDYCESENYCFSKHLNKIIENYIEHEKNYYAPPQVKALIRGYLTGKDYKGNELKGGWSSGKININWSSPKLIEWTSKYGSIPPNINEALAGDMEVDLFPINPQIISPIRNEPIQNFTQLVLHFKNLFHLRSGNQSLRSILERFNQVKEWHEKIDFEISENQFPNNLEHFTDVDKLIQTYNKLIQLIVEQHFGDNKPKVKLKYYESNQRIYLSIHHLNGKYNKTLDNTLNRPFGQSYSSMIEKQINGLCNLHLKADFSNGYYAEINLWDGKKLDAKEISFFEGVEHLLEFPKINKT